MHRAILSITGMLVACEPEVERFADCADAPCRQAWVTARLESDTQPTLDAVLTVMDPVERALLVGVVIDRHPEVSGTLCKRLGPGPDRDIACATDLRPHIWTSLPDVRPTRLRAGGGRRGPHWCLLPISAPRASPRRPTDTTPARVGRTAPPA
jgi:hypothetical protein